MRWLFEFFKNKKLKKDIVNKHSKIKNPNCIRLLDLKKYMDDILSQNRYIPKSEYTKKLCAEAQIVEKFFDMQSNNVIHEFCKKNKISYNIINNIMCQYNNFESIIDEHNENYINRTMMKEKNYLDNILKEVDTKIKLDEDQRRVVLTDEDNCLVVAGAGAGKTTTIAAKIRYLVEKKGIDPSQILVISFTNKSVDELKEKINKCLNIKCPIYTFHKTGSFILKEHSVEKMRVIDSVKLYSVLMQYFNNSILEDESLVNKLILFFGSYFDITDERDIDEDLNFTTMRSEVQDFKQQITNARTKKLITIKYEKVRSYQEVEIANFLYLNSIDYEYEPIYRYDIELSKKPYTPDFIIRQGDKVAYIEHFGITQDDKNDRFSDTELAIYKQAMKNKIEIHRQHGTKLIFTFSKYNDRRSLLEHLQEELKNNGFELYPRSNQEVMKKLMQNKENRYIKRFVNLVSSFIKNFKAKGFTDYDFKRIRNLTQNVRTTLFLDICHECYLEYERYLEKNKSIDFEDMINKSAQVLREIKVMDRKLDFKYIIVDEYQDISQQRFDLVTALAKVSNAKIMAVGDDWQSIYSFSGSDITLFTQFEEKMGYAKLLKIVNTYRNSQEVIDIAGNFIQKNTSQITKSLKSNKNIVNPMIIYTYKKSDEKTDIDNKDNTFVQAVENAIKQIIAFNIQESKLSNTSILLLGRFNSDIDILTKSEKFKFNKNTGKVISEEYPDSNITFMTAHASKGLGYDNVIVINCKNDIYGFPSQIEYDPVLNFVVKKDRSIDYAEERRLFYVAMTRTKNRAYFIAPEENPSEFLIEIKNNYKNVVLYGNWNEEAVQNSEKKKCPICGYPMQERYKNAYGLKLFICTNEPEICDFMTNEYKAGKLSILKCDRCRDGYLIVKPGKNDSYFLGCTNYKRDHTGCENFIAPKLYYKMFNLEPCVISEKECNTEVLK